VVYFGLRECGYLAIRKSVLGDVISPILASETVVGKTSAKSLDAEIRRIRETDAAMLAGGNDEAITRQVQLAIRNKARLLIQVKLVNGESATFELTPSGIANGRLRGLDRKSQIERTLPLSTITAISLA
jgi:ribosomal protein S3AE